MQSNEQRTEPDDGLIRRSYGLTVKNIDKERRRAYFIFSDASLDSYDEIVDQDWDLTRYLKNPVVLYNHNRGTAWVEPKHSLPIGHSEEVQVLKGALQGWVYFVTAEANPLAEQCWRCLVEGALRAGSVGFRPHEVRSEVHQDVDVYRLSKNELFEFSITPIGANQNAVLNSAQADRDRELIKSIAARTAAVKKGKTMSTPTPKSPTRSAVLVAALAAATASETGSDPGDSPEAFADRLIRDRRSKSSPPVPVPPPSPAARKRSAVALAALQAASLADANFEPESA